MATTMPLTIEEEEVDETLDYDDLVNEIIAARNNDRCNSSNLRHLYKRFCDEEWNLPNYDGFLDIVHKAGVDDATLCDDCEEPTWRRFTEFVEATDTQPCNDCLERNYVWCEHCGVYDDQEHDYHEGERGCDCEAPQQKFTFPNGTSTVKNDIRFTVAMTAGTISEHGIGEIARVLHAAGHYSLYGAVLVMDPAWQTKEGNFTTRLRQMAYKDYGTKLSDSVVSEIGNIANRHKVKASEYHLEFTRDLNLPAADFVNEGSCWWGDYSNSMCAFKVGGGIGLRAFEEGTSEAIARVWVLPLDKRLNPTSDIDGARAFFVFNPYGIFDNYTAAQIIGKMTGKTYKGVSAYIDPMYINSERGVLVADKETCEATTGINLHITSHAY